MIIVVTMQVIVMIAMHPWIHSGPRRMIIPGRFPTKSFPPPQCLFLFEDLSVQQLMPSLLRSLLVQIDGMPCASDSSASHSRPPSESSPIMIVETLIIIAHGPMMIRNAFSEVGRLRSMVRGELGLNVDFFMVIV